MTRRDITTEMDAASAEQSGEDHVLVIRGEEFILPGGSLPWDVSVELARWAKEQSSPFPAEQAGSTVAINDAMRIAFGPEQYQRVKLLMHSAAEFMVVVNAVTDLYNGADAGELPGSSGNFVTTGGQQKPTSNGSTPSISDEPASEPTIGSP